MKCLTPSKWFAFNELMNKRNSTAFQTQVNAHECKRMKSSFARSDSLACELKNDELKWARQTNHFPGFKSLLFMLKTQLLYDQHHSNTIHHFSQMLNHFAAHDFVYDYNRNRQNTVLMNATEKHEICLFEAVAFQQMIAEYSDKQKT